jgi:hypothetical protein
MSTRLQSGVNLSKSEGRRTIDGSMNLIDIGRPEPGVLASLEMCGKPGGRDAPSRLHLVKATVAGGAGGPKYYLRQGPSLYLSRLLFLLR